VLSGAVYVAQTDWLRETRGFVTDWTQAYVMCERWSADADTALDLAWCEYLFNETEVEAP
jgi:N-acylneuraminate cytidylyltransferase